MRAATPRRPPSPGGLPTRSRPSIPARCALLGFVLALGSGPGRAEDKTLVPATEPDLRGRLVEALRAGERGETDRAAALLGELVENRGSGLIEAPRRLARLLEEARGGSPETEGEGRAASERGGEDEAPEGRGRRFLRMGALLRGLAPALSAEVRERWREISTPAAEGLFARWRERRNPGDLERLARVYFLSDPAADAFEILGDRRLEAGDALEARRLYRAALEVPGLRPEARRRLVPKCLLARRWAGERAGHAELRARLLAGAGETLAGRVARLERAVPFADPDAVEPRRATSFWGGELLRGKPPSLPERPLKLSWASWAWADPPSIELSARRGVSARRLGRFHPRLLRSGTEVDHPFVPLVAGDRVWMSGVYLVHRIDGRAGAGKTVEELRKPDPAGLRGGYRYRERSSAPVYSTVLWRAAGEDPATRAALAPSEALDEVEEAIVTHYVSDRVVSENFMGYDVSEEIAVRSLVAWDARTGRRLWRTRPRDGEEGPGSDAGAGDAAAEDAGEALRRLERARRRRRRADDRADAYAPVEVPADISYTSPPVIDGGRVYAGGWSEEGFVNGLVRALDLRDGTTLWETLVSSSQMEQTMFGELAREPFASFVVLEGETLYCQTNQGAVAALDRATGDLLWATTYETIPIEPPSGPIPNLRDPVWSARPPLLLGWVLVVTPRDSRYILAIDTGRGPRGEAGAGRVLWSYHNASGDLRDLLGYYRGRLYFTGPRGAAYLDLEGLPPLAEEAGGREPRKVVGAPARRRGTVPAGGDLTRDGVVYADEERLWLADLELDEPPVPLTREPFPVSEHGEYAGRVRVEGDRVLVVSNSILSAFVPAAPPGGPQR